MRHFVGLIFLLLCGCKQEFPDVPKDIIPVEKMKTILIEMHIADSVAETKAQTGGDEKVLTKSYTAQIFKNNGISREEYLKSFSWYESHPKLLNKMYDDILAELSKREETVGKK
jgi:hypothetical protein